MATLDATVGGVLANSYETVAEANEYYTMRLPITAWENGDQALLLMMATRVLDAMAMPLRMYVPAKNGVAAHFVTRRMWAGAPATQIQRLAWPRTGLFDMNGRSLSPSISSHSVANPTVITTATPHGIVTGQRVLIDGVVGSSADINGERVATFVSATQFSIPVNVITAGIGGYVYIIPQALKDALAELAGALATSDSTLDNEVVVQGIKSVKAGSVALTFNDMIEQHVLPDMVWNLMPPSWFTSEIIEPAMPAQFDVVV